jgi:sec-independent protein translocase protein TatB
VFGIGMTELLVILVIGLLVLGPKRLPELARSLGRGLAEFRRASTDMRKEFLDVTEEARIEPFGDEASGAKSEAPDVPHALADSPAGVEPEPAPKRAEASETSTDKTPGTPGE